MSDPSAGASAYGGGRPPVRRGARLALVALCAVLFVLFSALGVWQVQRLFWKLDLIERVEARIHAAPVPAPRADAFAAKSPADLEYRRVSVSGHFLHDRETLVQAVTERGGGFWVLTPLRTPEGSTVLVNRGFVPPENRPPESRQAGNPAGEVTITGLLRLSEPKGGYLRDNDPAANRWYSRDVDAIAASRDLGSVAPYFVDAEASSIPGGLPVGGLTVVRFTNNHLVYALTWFVLAAMSAGGAVWIGRRP